MVGVDTWLHFVVPLFPANGALRHVLWNSMQSLKMVVYSKKFLNLYVHYIICIMCVHGGTSVSQHVCGDQSINLGVSPNLYLA